MGKIDTTKWELIRCVYDYMGINCSEVDRPEKFARMMERGETASYFIGKKFVHNGKPCVTVILEGGKEILEYVLEKVKKLKNDKSI